MSKRYNNDGGGANPRLPSLGASGKKRSLASSTSAPALSVGSHSHHSQGAESPQGSYYSGSGYVVDGDSNAVDGMFDEEVLEAYFAGSEELRKVQLKDQLRRRKLYESMKKQRPSVEGGTRSMNSTINGNANLANHGNGTPSRGSNSTNVYAHGAYRDVDDGLSYGIVSSVNSISSKKVYKGEHNNHGSSVSLGSHDDVSIWSQDTRPAVSLQGRGRAQREQHAQLQSLIIDRLSHQYANKNTQIPAGFGSSTPTHRLGGTLDGEHPKEQFRGTFRGTEERSHMSGDIDGSRDEESQGGSEEYEHSDSEGGGVRYKHGHLGGTDLNSMHFASHLLHRVTGTTGGLPGPPATDFDSVNNDECGSSVISETSRRRAEDGREQMIRLGRNPSLLAIIKTLQKVGITFQDTIHSVYAHRKHLGDQLRRVRSLYLQLFEDMLKELLRMQRHREQKYLDHTRDLENKLNDMIVSDRNLKTLEDVHEKQVDALITTNQALRAQVIGLDAMVVAAQEAEKLAIVLEEERRISLVERESKRMQLVQRLKEEEETLRKRVLSERVDEQKAVTSLRSMAQLEAKIQRVEKAQEQTFRVDYSKFKPIVPVTDMWCQTLTDDDGLWDIQDGCVREISRDRFLRFQWQHARRFASCPACKGAGSCLVQKTKRNLPSTKDRATDDPTLHHQLGTATTRVKIPPLDNHWSMPNRLVDFMCNLPKTAQGMKVRSLRWLVRQIWAILDEKERVDAIDDFEGQPTQDMIEFMIELYLRWYGLRQDAELALYTLLISVKRNYKKSTCVWTFARLLDLLNEVDDPEENKTIKKNDGLQSEEQDEEDMRPKYTTLDATFQQIMTFTRRRLLYRKKADVAAEKARKVAERNSMSEQLPQVPPPPPAPLRQIASPGSPTSAGGRTPRPIAGSFTVSRKTLTMKGAPVEATVRAAIPTSPGRDSSSGEDNDADPFSDTATSSIPIDVKKAAEARAIAAEQAIPNHIVIGTDGVSLWVPLADFVSTFMLVMGWLPSDRLHAYLRVMERSAELLGTNGTTVVSAEGYRTVIRSIMRKLLNPSSGNTDANGNPEMDTSVLDHRGVPIRPMVDMDRVLQVVMDIMYKKQSLITTTLKRLFVEGDDNGDGVLSYDEFNAIVLQCAPDFSERRVLRMFREALTSGSGSSFAIETETFCTVCKKHGLAQLVNIRELEQRELGIYTTHPPETPMKHAAPHGGKHA